MPPDAATVTIPFDPLKQDTFVVDMIVALTFVGCVMVTD